MFESTIIIKNDDNLRYSQDYSIDKLSKKERLSFIASKLDIDELDFFKIEIKKIFSGYDETKILIITKNLKDALSFFDLIRLKYDSKLLIEDASKKKKIFSTKVYCYYKNRPHVFSSLLEASVYFKNSPPRDGIHEFNFFG